MQLQRVTKQKIEARFEEYRTLYLNDASIIQELKSDELVSPAGVPSRVFKVAMSSTTTCEIVRAIQKVATLTDAEVISDYQSAYSMIRQSPSYSDLSCTLYFKKSQSAIDKDMVLLMDIAQQKVEREVQEANERQKQTQQEELFRIKKEEEKEFMELAQAKQNKIEREQRKRELEQNLGLSL